MDKPPTFDLTAEQAKFRDDLVKRFGQVTVTRAYELSGLSLALTALAQDELSVERRTRLYEMASLHLAELLGTMLTAQESAAVSDCAKRIDSAMDVWMADQIEARDGLPKGTYEP